MFPAILPLPVLLLALTLTVFFLKSKYLDRSLPPGPPAFPVFGNLPMLLGKLPHRTLQAMARRYGPIMSLRLGQVPTVVISNSEAVELFLKTHDAVFASRPKMQATEYMSYGSKGLVFSEYGPYWRNMRRLFTSQLLSVSKVSSFTHVREGRVKVAVKSIKRAAERGEVVDISELVYHVVEEVVYRIVLGRSRKDGFDLANLLHEANSIAGAFNLANYMPWLGSFDLQN
ncbi:hypothetical protein PIB30_079235 [Stylosanthes scabra]|uniref:Uncharacterized protein n=1 Tax=Stylosanthes scabra TaxID=79078 RepID=A0ABU6VS97_9FABA|nr:hypothetical protein [Stylosanthes scabra]